MWDAWDLDPFYRNSLRVVTDRSVSNVVVEHDRVEIHSTARIDSSSMELVWIFTSGSKAIDLHVEADWHEHEKLLKLSIPVELHTDHAQYETQMGYITRPTHENTSWDAYRFEVSPLGSLGKCLAFVGDRKRCHLWVGCHASPK